MYNNAEQLFKKLTDINLPKIKSILDYRSPEDKFENSIFQTEKDAYITGMNFSFDLDYKEQVILYVYTNKEKIVFDYELNKVLEIEKIY